MRFSTHEVKIGLGGLLAGGMVLGVLVMGSNGVQAQINHASNLVKGQHIPVCPGPASPASARCHAQVVSNQKGAPNVTAAPAGYGPAQFRTAYQLSGQAATRQTIAIVDAYDDPYALSDLNTYSQQFGLPTMASCAVSSGTVARPCFQKVSQTGTTRYPRADAGWSLEISLDIQTAHAICQNCNILLVEASSSSYTNLLAAEDRAVKMGATVVSNSWGSSEFSGEATYDSHFNHPGVAFTVSSGDNGYGAQYPAASPYVTAVGGTTLNLNADNSYKSETVWNGAGSGCSVYEAKPSFQNNLTIPCTNRSVADVSADADPNTGAAVYDSMTYQGQHGWFQVGGTSLAAPLVAGVYALSGGIPAGVQGNTLPYSNGSYGTSLHDVVSGSTTHCDGTVLCSAGAGYDGASGLGTPLGLGAF